jgi:hypothetical protein
MSRYTPTHASQQEPMKSVRTAKSFRLVSVGVGQGSRTKTRTKSPRTNKYLRQKADKNHDHYGDNYYFADGILEALVHAQRLQETPPQCVFIGRRNQVHRHGDAEFDVAN